MQRPCRYKAPPFRNFFPLYALALLAFLSINLSQSAVAISLDFLEALENNLEGETLEAPSVPYPLREETESETATDAEAPAPEAPQVDAPPSSEEVSAPTPPTTERVLSDETDLSLSTWDWETAWRDGLKMLRHDHWPWLLAGLILSGATILLLVVYLFSLLFGRVRSHVGSSNDGALGLVLGSLILDQQTAVYYVQTGGQVLVLGVTPSTVNLLRAYDTSAFTAAQDRELHQAMSTEEDAGAFDTLDAPDAPLPPQDRTQAFREALREEPKSAKPQQGANPRPTQPKPDAKPTKGETPNKPAGKAPKAQAQENQGDDIAALQKDLQRLRQYIQKGKRE